MKINQDIILSGSLDAVSIDRMSDTVADLCVSANAGSKDTLRMRLSVETVMGIWAEELGENTVCELVKTSRFKKITYYLRADGRSVDPTQYQDDLLLSISSNPNMAAALGLPAEYRYRQGRNELILHIPQKKRNPILKVLIAIIAAILVGGGMRLLCPEIAAAISAQLFTPLMNTIINALCLLAGPLVFLSIISGVSGIGDATSFGKVGGTLAKRFFLITLFIGFLVWLSVSWLFPAVLTNEAQGENAFQSLFEMVLSIVPKDIVTPFQTGNAMQIIFLAVCVGVGIIILGDTVIETVTLLNQINSIIQLLMKGVSGLLPFFIFLSITTLIITSSPSELTQILIPLLLITGINLLMPLIYGVYTSIRTGIPVRKLFKSQYPTFLIALTTASSAAAFSSNVECCTKDLKIDEKLVKFGVPFGQVLFMPGAATLFIITSLYMAKVNQITMTPAWIFTMLIIVTILAMAAPPIPGGALSGLMILFTQLGIPASCVAMCAAILTFADYSSTSCNICCLQQELLVSAKKLKMLKIDKDSK